MIILSIADLHLKTGDGTYTDTFKNSLDSFENYLKVLVKSETDWQPDFLCICGDIVNSGKTNEYGLAKDVIKQICSAIGLSTDYVMMVPGNHDLSRKCFDDKNKKGLLRKSCEWLEGDFNRDKNKKIITPEHIVKMFETYSVFRSELLNENPPFRYFDLMATIGCAELHGLCGLRIFDNDKIVFAELNSSWCDFGGDMRHTRLGHILTNYAYQRLLKLKRMGYFIVGMFHHSLRYLDLEEYQVRTHFEVYDNIIKICDLCISGHEHGAKAKDPDFLGNSCQYVLNAGFLSADPENNLYESGATLIRIDRNDETIQVRKLVRYTDNTWHEPEQRKVYSIAERRITNLSPGIQNEYFPDAGKRKGFRYFCSIVMDIFGTNYKLGKSVDEIADAYVLTQCKTDSSLAKAFIVFVDPSVSVPEQITFKKSEPDIKTFVINVDNLNSVESRVRFNGLIDRHMSDILCGNMIFLSINSVTT